MMRFQNTTPHFFQPLIPGYLSNFSIPKSFRKYLQDDHDNEKVAILRDKRGRSWSIKIDHIKLQFKDGWKRFCEEHDMKVGDFVVFRHEGDFVFDVFIFDPTACERDFPISVVPLELIMLSSSTPPTNVANNPPQGLALARRENKNGSEQSVIGFKPTGNPFCPLIIKAYNYKSSALYIPREFARKSGLDRQREVEIIDEKGRKWVKPFRFMADKAYIGNWKDFHLANGLTTGDNVILEVIHTEEHLFIKFHTQVAQTQPFTRSQTLLLTCS